MLQKINLQFVIQAVAVFFLLSLPLLFFYGQNKQVIFTVPILLRYAGFCLVFIVIYLLHSFFLYPKLYHQKKHLTYLLSLALVLGFIITIRPFDQLIAKPNSPSNFIPPAPQKPNQQIKPIPPKGGRPLVDIISISIFLLIIALDITKATNKQLSLTMQRALQAEAEKAQAELSFLKAQVNPHFLFNILNNIYTLAIIKADQTAPSIMKLSNMMRYLTDEAGNDFVTLQEEVDCITDYIDLQSLRLTQKTSIVFEVNGNLEGKKIAPLILMAFVENVFKYGVSNHKKSTLSIRINIENQMVNFFCENTIHHNKTTAKRTGIGLENTKKRLSYIYPDRYLLVINATESLFKVNLTLHL